MKTTFDRLARIIEIKWVSAEKPSAADWRAFEEENLVLPSDYKELIGKLGEGLLGDFFWIWSPFSRHSDLNWRIQKELSLTSLKEAATDSPQLYGGLKLHPEVGGLLPCLHTMNGDTLFWVTTGKADEWTIAVGKEAPFDFFSGNLCQFLVHALTEPPIGGALPDLRNCPKVFSKEATWLKFPR